MRYGIGAKIRLDATLNHIQRRAIVKCLVYPQIPLRECFADYIGLSGGYLVAMRLIRSSDPSTDSYRDKKSANSSTTAKY